MGTRKKIFQFLSSVILYSLIVILILIGAVILISGIDQFIAKKNNQSRPALFSAYIIISPSMIPNINVQDAVFTMRVPDKYIKLYDIITFLSKEIDTNGTPITHRIVGIVETESGAKAYRTKGDNNASEDRALIRQDEVLGKVLFRIPMIGYVKTFLSSKLGWILVIALPCIMIIGYDILKITGLIQKKNSSDEHYNDSRNSDNNIIEDFGSQNILDIKSEDVKNVSIVNSKNSDFDQASSQEIANYGFTQISQIERLGPNDIQPENSNSSNFNVEHQQPSDSSFDQNYQINSFSSEVTNDHFQFSFDVSSDDNEIDDGNKKEM